MRLVEKHQHRFGFDALESDDRSLLQDGAVLLLPLYNYSDGDHTALYEQFQDPDRRPYAQSRCLVIDSSGLPKLSLGGCV